jgi:hypothetical protein
VRKDFSVLARATLATALAIAATTAHAIPLVFNFTGSVSSRVTLDTGGNASYDHSLDGQAMSGWITLETDGLVTSSTTNERFDRLTFADSIGDSVEWVTSGLTIGGVAYDVGGYQHDYGQLAYLDSNGPTSCGPNCTSTTPDQWMVLDESRQLPNPAPNTRYNTRALSLSVYDALNQFGFIDLSQGFDALSVLTLPSAYATGLYQENTWFCGSSDSCNVQRTSTWLQINSLSISAPPSVPEPGTLALLAMGIFGTALTRRSKKSRRS